MVRVGIFDGVGGVVVWCGDWSSVPERQSGRRDLGRCDPLQESKNELRSRDGETWEIASGPSTASGSPALRILAKTVALNREMGFLPH